MSSVICFRPAHWEGGSSYPGDKFQKSPRKWNSLYAEPKEVEDADASSHIRLKMSRTWLRGMLKNLMNWSRIWNSFM